MFEMTLELLDEYLFDALAVWDVDEQKEMTVFRVAIEAFEVCLTRSSYFVDLLGGFDEFSFSDEIDVFVLDIEFHFRNGIGEFTIFNFICIIQVQILNRKNGYDIKFLECEKRTIK
jgi:hypothetical protein